MQQQQLEDSNNLEQERLELLRRKDELGNQQIDHQNKLALLRNEFRRKGRMPQIEYNRLCRKQQTHKECIGNIHKELGPIRNRLAEIGMMQQQQHHHQHNTIIEITTQNSLLNSLLRLRDDYQTFSADLTRVASMRSMAAQFVLRLDDILKQHLDNET